MRKLKNTFGAPFLVLISSVYWTQGFRSLAWLAVSYQMKDELKLNPAASQFVMSTAFLPWSVKPLYGIFSDCVPIRRQRRIPYMVISSVLCFIPWLVLAKVQASRSSSYRLMTLLTIQNIGAALADVVVDAMVAESARQERAEFAGDLQSLSWFSMAFGGIMGSVSGGTALEKLGVEGIFMLFACFPVLQLCSCLFVREQSFDRGESEENGSDNTHFEDLRDNFAPETAVESDWVPVVEDEVSEADDADKLVRASGGLRRRRLDSGGQSSSSVEATQKLHDRKLAPAFKQAFLSLYRAVKEPMIFRPMLWFLLSQAMVPNLSSIMFYYQTNYLKLDASFLGMSRVVGWGGLMLGTFVYNRFLKRVSLRTIFSFVHILVALLTLTDVLLVSRLNSRFGIPDKAFVLGASAVGDVVMQFKFMPFLVFSGQICPPGIEGTLFALFMSINNLGGTLSSFGGATLASALGISADNFDKLGTGIIVQAACTLLPVFFVFLVPGKPSA